MSFYVTFFGNKRHVIEAVSEPDALQRAFDMYEVFLDQGAIGPHDYVDSLMYVTDKESVEVWSLDHGWKQASFVTKNRPKAFIRPSA